MMRTLQDLSNQELFDLARLFTDQLPTHPPVILDIAAELRKRGLYATEDAMLRLAAIHLATN